MERLEIESIHANSTRYAESSHLHIHVHFTYILTYICSSHKLALFYIFLLMKSCLFYKKRSRPFISIHTFSHTSYTPFHQTLHPYTLHPYTIYKNTFLTTISPISSILKILKWISAVKHLLFFCLLSSLFHKHKTSHFFSTDPKP